MPVFQVIGENIKIDHRAVIKVYSFEIRLYSFILNSGDMLRLQNLMDKVTVKEYFQNIENEA